jgi:hypothetical protein
VRVAGEGLVGRVVGVVSPVSVVAVVRVLLVSVEKTVLGAGVLGSLFVMAEMVVIAIIAGSMMGLMWWMRKVRRVKGDRVAWPVESESLIPA